MRLFSRPPAVIIFLVLIFSCGGHQVRFEVTEELLDNGLRVILHEDHSVPVISYRTFYRVGSRNEMDGMRGISQLIEHMMFSGTDSIGPGEFDRIIEERGGSASGYTTRDMTVYTAEFHRDLLEEVVELEADRMRNLAFPPEELSREKGIVAEERLRYVDNSVRGRMREKLFALAFRQHPYRYPTLGTEDELKALTAEDCRDYYRRYYISSNAVIVAAGDFDASAALELIRRYYGPIPKGELPEEEIPVEPPQAAQRRDTLDLRWRMPVVRIGFRTPPAGSEDIYALDLLQILLDGGRFSRLPLRLEEELGLAVSVRTFFPWRIDPALFIVTVRLRSGRDPGEAVEEVYSILEDIAENGVGGEELRRAKNMIRAGYLRGMESIEGRADKLGRYQVLLGSWKMIYRVQERYREIEPEDISRAARRYLRRDNSSVVYLLEGGEKR